MIIISIKKLHIVNIVRKWHENYEKVFLTCGCGRRLIRDELWERMDKVEVELGNTVRFSINRKRKGAIESWNIIRLSRFSVQERENFGKALHIKDGNLWTVGHFSLVWFFFWYWKCHVSNTQSILVSFLYKGRAWIFLRCGIL